MRHYQLQVILATAKQEPLKSRPPWGKGDRASGGRGELALNLRLPPNQRTYPNSNHANKTALTTQGHTTPQASSPSPSPHGCHLSPKGVAYCMNHANKPHYTRKAIQSRKQAPPLRHPNGRHLSPKGEAKLLTAKHVQNPKAVPLGGRWQA